MIILEIIEQQLQGIAPEQLRLKHWRALLITRFPRWRRGNLLGYLRFTTGKLSREDHPLWPATDTLRPLQ